MKKNSEVITTADLEKMDANEYYDKAFMPRVHVIGRFTMSVAFFLSFASVLYFIIFKKYTLPAANYLNVFLAIGSIGLGLWLTEPLAFWPTLGSAGTYISYLSGNVSGMRFPVALNVQTSSGSDIGTPRGQVITIVGIVASVFMNLIILTIIILSGTWLINLLPKFVIASFAFVMSCLCGSLLMMRFYMAKKKSTGNLLKQLLYLSISLAIKFLLDTFLPQLITFALLIAVGTTILVAYIMFKRENQKTTQAS